MVEFQRERQEPRSLALGEGGGGEGGLASHFVGIDPVVPDGVLGYLLLHRGHTS